MERTPAVRIFSRWRKKQGMAMSVDRRPNIDALAAAIARSPIVVRHAISRRRLPAGFEAVDAAILGWIAAEARRVGRGLVRM
jgi:hypothetical protein